MRHAAPSIPCGFTRLRIILSPRGCGVREPSVHRASSVADEACGYDLPCLARAGGEHSDGDNLKAGDSPCVANAIPQRRTGWSLWARPAKFRADTQGQASSRGPHPQTAHSRCTGMTPQAPCTPIWIRKADKMMSGSVCPNAHNGITTSTKPEQPSCLCAGPPLAKKCPKRMAPIIAPQL